MENKGTFNYTYSAKEQEEIQNIRKKYEAPEKTEDKMERLRHLDTAVTQKATVVSLVFGVIGIVLVCVAYPVYNRILKNECEKSHLR